MVRRLFTFLVSFRVNKIKRLTEWFLYEAKALKKVSINTFGPLEIFLEFLLIIIDALF